MMTPSPSILRSTRLATAALAAAVALGGGAGLAAADNVEIRMATLAPDGSSWIKVLAKAGAEIETKTAARVKVKYYAGGVQGDEKDVVRKINLGQLDGAAVTSIGLGMIEPSIRVLELPLMFKSVEELDYVADKMWSHFTKKFDEKGWILQDRGEVGWVYFMSKDKIDSLASLKATKMWLWGDDDLVRASFKKVGINGTPLGVPEVEPALASGRINAAYSSPLAAVALQWNTKIKYVTSMPMSFAIGATVVKKDLVKKLSAEDYALVKKVAKAASKTLRKQIRKDNASALKTMTRKGVQIVETPPAMIAEFETLAKAVWNEQVGKLYSKTELDLVLKYRDEYRAKNPGK
jgi:TRAP-type C4-dicarboxylate transport system substrate-binding protein